ncbi:efflux RND transporter periplasmic adaptor subunit [Gammaproteobacteria bacterium AB-CW1]|uniref:Efflux RND transporter periplasmic adaptor subunit n=1 Tax=Natronospira elongata TaxID=3110268 RepID=A0AAP6JG51_9GAMM|nr:efflux RND transporter periplasmic adaptor subunit [Gammaproteobacteria bacterium AB-CW1]
MPRKFPWLTWPRLIVAVVAVLILVPMASDRLLGPRISVLTVDSGTLRQNVVTTGRVLTRHRVQLGSEIVGKVRRVNTDEGEWVEADEPLVELDGATQRASLARAETGLARAKARRAGLLSFERPDAEAAVGEARANLAQAEREAERRQRLLERELISAEELDRSRLEIQRAEAALTRARLRRQSLQEDGSEWLLAEQEVADAQYAVALAAAELEKTRIASQVEGMVLRRQVEPGDTVQPGTTLLLIAPDGPLIIEAPVDEISLEGLSTGQRAMFEADAYPGRPFEGELVFVGPQVDPERGNVNLRFEVAEPPAFLRQDMTVSVDIQVGERDGVLALPNQALDDVAGDRARVWRVVDNQVEAVEVTLGLRGLDKSEVLEGLEEGDRILPANADVEAGQRVRAR